MGTVIPDTVVRQEVTSTTTDNNNIILLPEGCQNVTYSAIVAASGTGNKIEASVSSMADVQAGSAEWFTVVANVTQTAHTTTPSALVDGNNNPITVTALRAVFADQNITLVVLASRIAQ